MALGWNRVVQAYTHPGGRNSRYTVTSVDNQALNPSQTDTQCRHIPEIAKSFLPHTGPKKIGNIQDARENQRLA